MESAGIRRDGVTLFLRNINGSYETENHIYLILNECDNRFKEGNLTKEVFAACATFTLSYTKHIQQIFDENLQPISVIISNSSSSH